MRTPGPPRDAKAAVDLVERTLQGFSVVIVLGDMQSTSTSDTVPAAARKALTDMKNFLPYKGYRLLDAQWILGAQKASTRLRGPDEQDYQLTLRSERSQPIEPGKLRVFFQLQEPGEPSALETSELASRQAQLAALRDRLQTLEAAARERAKTGGERQPIVVQIGQETAGLRRQIAALEGSMSHARGRDVIDTSFGMDVGETVVVGTSRVRGDKALIALLTAVSKASAGRK